MANGTNSSLYMVTNNTLFKFDKRTYAAVHGYGKLKNLASAVFFNESIIAVVDESEGVTLYTVQDDAATFLYTFRKEYFGWDIDLGEVVAYKKRDLLIIDRARGVVNISIAEEINKSPFSILLSVSNCSLLQMH